MVNLGGEHTMLGQWRIVLKQAEEAARAGRFDEALALAARPDVADHRQAVILRAKLASDLLGRGIRRGEADDAPGAIADLDLAEAHGAAPDALASARMKLAEGLAEEIEAEFSAGEPARVADRVAGLASHKVSGPRLRRLREAAEAWRKALDDARRGEFGLAEEGLDRANRLAGGLGADALAASSREVAGRRDKAQTRVERLYQALSAGKWGETLAAAEAVLEVIPDHPAARGARTRAWQQIGAINPAATLPGRSSRGVPPTAPIPAPAERPAPIRFLASSSPSPGPAPAASPNRAGIVFLDSAPKSSEASTVPWNDATTRRASIASSRPESRLRGRFLLWADAIGGYLVCLDDEVILGRSGPDSPADVPLLGDLSRDHAAIIRDGDGYVLKAKHATFLNGRKVDAAPLRNGDVIRLGSTVELEFRQPSPVRLDGPAGDRQPPSPAAGRGRGDPDGRDVHRGAQPPGARPRGEPGGPGGLLSARRRPLVPGRRRVLGGRQGGLGPGALALSSSVVGEGFSFGLEPLNPNASA